MQRKIVLASKSERRRALLKQLGLEFEVKESEYEEDMSVKKNPYELAKHLALEKAKDVAKNYNDAIIIGADTFVVFEGKFIGKPKDEEDAKKILRKLSGVEHEIISGVAIIDTKSSKVFNDFGEARVRFRNLADEEINDYVATGEPLSMAGSYGLMNKAAGLIDSIDGDFYSIIGLPLNKVFMELRKMGAKVF